MARRLGLATAEKPESQEICFVPGGDYRDALRDRAGWHETPGSLLDGDGRVVGEHRGAAAYTVGQRTGLGVALGERRYVAAIDARGEPRHARPPRGPRASRIRCGGGQLRRRGRRRRRTRSRRRFASGIAPNRCREWSVARPRASRIAAGAGGSDSSGRRGHRRRVRLPSSTATTRSSAGDGSPPDSEPAGGPGRAWRCTGRAVRRARW